jgi:endonuclease-3 related protein
MTTRLREVYDRLFAAFGPQYWWPGESPMEVTIGAVLVQNTNWQNVEKAIANLREHDLVDPHAICELDGEELEELIRPAGYFRVKARRLRSLMQFLVDRYEGRLERMFRTDLPTLRAELLGVHGVGPETADSILLYAGGLPTFVVDTYTHRVAARHGWIGFEAGYYELKELFESGIEEDVKLYNEFHALLVRVGKHFCKKTPKCPGCPLEELLPAGGPMEPFD